MSTKNFSLLSIPSLGATQDFLDKFKDPIDQTPGTYGHITMAITNSIATIFSDRKPIEEFSFVWVTADWKNIDLAHAIDLYLSDKKIPHTQTEYAASKITDVLTFSLTGLPVPDSVYISPSQSLKESTLIPDICGFPVIVKDVKGSGGRNSSLANNQGELEEIIANLPKDKRFMYQRFIPNDYDWGIMVANGVVVSGERSYAAEGQFTNNLAGGAVEKFTAPDEIPKKIKDLALKASASLNLPWSRTDIIVDKETALPYVLEVNRYPGVTPGSEEVDGAYTFLNSHIKDLVAA